MKKRQTTQDICKKVTDIIVDGLNKDICPWIKPWASSEIGGAPHNYNSKKDYHGSNTIILTMVMMSKGYQFNSWVTYNGAKQLGGSVKRGEKGTPVVFWKFFEYEVKDSTGNVILDDDGVPVTDNRPILKTFTVFNIEQCEGIEMPEAPEKPEPVDRIKVADNIVSNYKSKNKTLKITEKLGNRAYYAPADDMIVVPTIEQSVDKALQVGQTEEDGKQHFYSTMFHEMVHSTGHESRLNRDTLTKSNYFGSHEYSKEELVAEIGSAILCYKAGLESERVMENTSAYCKGWAKKLKSEPSWIIWAGGRAEKASDFILK